MPVTNCPRCAAARVSPLACAACGAVFAVPDDSTPFDVLGFAPSHALEPADVRKRVTTLARLCHPDFHAADPEARALAERASARLNEAQELLSSPTRRADWLVRSLGGPDERAEGQMPQEFLLEVLEWNELLEEARHGAVDVTRLDALRSDLAQRRQATVADIAQMLEPLPPQGDARLSAVRRSLNAVRYLDRALAELEALRLARAAAR